MKHWISIPESLAETLSHYAYVVAFFAIVLGLLSGKAKATHVFGLVVLALVLFGFMDLHHIYTAAVNPSILTVMALIALTSVIKKRVDMMRILKYSGKHPRSFLFRSTLFTAALSGFVNNTPVVALLIPSIKTIAQRRGWNASLFLMPLSFAAVAGGTLTLIGTSTHLVLNGLMIENGIPSFQFWDFLIPGFAVTCGVLLTTLLLSPLLFKNKSSQEEEFNVKSRTYTTELKVIPNGSMEGKTVQEAGLRSLDNLFLAELLRDGVFISPVSPGERLQANDTLFFSGALDRVNELLDQFSHGLKNVERKFDVDTRRNLIEVIVPNNSDLIGRPLKETNFRARYDAVIIGVHRQGKPLQGKIGRLSLQAGDLLLISAGSTFSAKNLEEPTLIAIEQHERLSPNKVGREKYFLPSLPVIGVLAYLFQWSLLVSVGLMLVSGIICGVTHSEKLKNEFNLQLYALLILSVAFGSALVEGNHATYFIDQIPLPENATAGLVLLFILTLLLTNFMTNVSAVATLFPIAVAFMNHYGLDSKTVFLLLAYGASASFLTATSYQTHLMVMGPGNYTNRDFQKLGLPVLIVYASIALWVLL